MSDGPVLKQTIMTFWLGKDLLVYRRKSTHYLGLSHSL